MSGREARTVESSQPDLKSHTSMDFFLSPHAGPMHPTLSSQTLPWRVSIAIRGFTERKWSIATKLHDTLDHVNTEIGLALVFPQGNVIWLLVVYGIWVCH